MAIQLLPQEQDSTLAHALGGLSGLSLGILGGYAANQYKLPSKIKNLEAFGFSPEESKALANAPESVQSAAIKEKMKAREREQQAALFSNLVSGGQQTPVQPVPQPGVNALNALQPEQQAPVPQPGKAPDIGQMLQSRTVNDLQEYRDRVLKSGGNPQLVKDAVSLIDKEIDTKIKQEGIQSKEKSDAFKATAIYRKSMAERHQSDENLEHVLDEMDKYDASGKMTDPTWLQFMEMFGLDYNILKSPETEAYQALEKEFLRDLKSIFGGRISNQEMVTFLKSIPRASNTPEGRKLIKQRLRALYDARKLQYKAMRKIIKDNNGVPPLDLQERVLDEMHSEKYRKKDEKYANQFRGGENTPDPSKVKRYRDTETGQIMVSNGREFVPEG